MTQEKLRVNQSDGKLVVGGVLDQSQVEALGSVTPSADDILNNMELYNEELQETYGNLEEEREMPEAKVPKASRKRRRSKNINAAATEEVSAKPKRKRNIPKEEDLKMDLDQELENLDNQISESQAAAQQAEAPADMRGQIMELLNNTPGAPSEAQIAKWKAQYGDNGVHVMALGEGDVYIFTHLKRGQWKKIQEMMAKIQEAGTPDVEDQLKEKVLGHCCLWPQLGVEFFYNSRAGVADSLYQVVLLNSYFLSPQQAMLLTTQL